MKRDCTQSHSMKPLTQSNLTCKLYIFDIFSHLCDISYFRDQPSIKPYVPSDQQKTALNGSLETPSFGSENIQCGSTSFQTCRPQDFLVMQGKPLQLGKCIGMVLVLPSDFFAQLKHALQPTEKHNQHRERSHSVWLWRFFPTRRYHDRNRR